MARNRKPAKVIVEPYRARVVRGPHKDGSGRWYWRARMFKGQKGGAVTVWTGWALRDEVADRLKTLTGAEPVTAGVDPTVQTVKDLLECWKAAQIARADVSASWQRAVRNGAKHLGRVLGGYALSGLARDRTALDSYRDQLLRDGWAPGTVKQHLKMLRAAWAWGQEMGVCPDRSLPKTRLKVTPVRDTHTPSRADVLAVLDKLTAGWPQLMGLLLFSTGARIGEIAALTWADVHLDAGEVRLDGKTGPRTVPLSADAVAALSAWTTNRESDHAVLGVTFWTAKKHFGPRYLTPACTAAKVRPFTPHALRRAAVDAFARAGVDIGTAAAFLGHSPTVMLEHYRRVSIEDRRRALQAAALGQLEGGEVIAFPNPGSTVHMASAPRAQ